MYFEVARVFLGMGLILNGQMHEAHDILKGVLNFSRKFGVEFIGTPAKGYLGVVQIAKGHMSQGIRIIKEISRSYLIIERRNWHATLEYTLGKVFLQIAERAGPMSLSTIFKNVSFLLKNAPFASRKAENHFNKAIEVAKEIGAKGVLGQAYLDLGLLHRAKKRPEQAKKCISEAINFFKRCGAETYLKQAKEVLISLK